MQIHRGSWDLGQNKAQKKFYFEKIRILINLKDIIYIFDHNSFLLLDVFMPLTIN